MDPAPLEGIAGDSSHAARWGNWLETYRRVADQHDDAYLQRLQSGTVQQLLTHVLIPPSPDLPAFRTTNYMDGHNGLYQWKPGDGSYRPYELSGTLCLGWWSFLPGDEIAEFFHDFEQTFSLDPAVIETYQGPDNRERHPLLAWPDYFRNGVAHTIVKMAAFNSANRG